MKLSQEHLTAVWEYIDAHREEIIAMWRDYVNLRSDATVKEKAEVMALRLQKDLEEMGCRCTLTDMGEKNGPAVDAILGEDRPGKPVLF